MQIIKENSIVLADSRQLESFLSPNSVDLILTGPPYFNEVVYSDDLSQLSKISDYQIFLQELGRVWTGCAEILKDGGIIAIWAHDFFRKESNAWKYIPFHTDILKMMPSNLTLRTITVWDRYLPKYQSPMPDTGPLGTRVQYLMILQKAGTHSANKDLISRSLAKHFWEPVWTYKTHPELLGSRVLFRLARGFIRPFKSIFSLPVAQLFHVPIVLRDRHQFQHYTTECPEEIAQRCIREFSKPGDLVIDPFIGSGTTFKVALKLNRRCIGIDINERAIESISKKVCLGNVRTYNMKNQS